MSTTFPFSAINGLSDANSPSTSTPANYVEAPDAGAPPAPGPAPMATQSPTAQAVGNTPAPAVARPNPNAPHAGLMTIMQSLFEGMGAFARSAATGGREGGVQEVEQLQERRQQLALEQKREQTQESLADAQIKHTQALTNASIAQLEILKMNAPAEHQKLVIDNQKSLYDLLVNTLHVNPIFAVPIVQGQTTDAHMSAINGKANGDLVGNTVLPVHDDTVGGAGNSYGFSFDQLRQVNIPIDQAAPVLANLQNQINFAKSVLPDGEKDPAIQVAQGKLDIMKKGATVNGFDFFNFDNQLQAQVLSRVANNQAISEYQQKQAAATKAKQEADPLFKLENDPGQMAGEKASAAIPMLQSKITDPTTSADDKLRATRLLAVANSAHARYLGDQAAKANAEQLVKQGDPAAAGAMLAKGDITLAELKTRGTTTKFIQQAIEAAQKADPTYKPADELIAEQQAKSQGNVQFFGSANSLIQKGGTLDLLSAAGKNLPDYQLPIFNKIADFTSAESGRSTLPGYAAIALGVADDYAKVMGGGQGSDASRMQVYNSIAASLNQGQRDAVVQGMKRAVGSQVESRIGTNQFMRRIYGYGLANVTAAAPPPASAPAGPPAGATGIAPGSDGRRHYHDAKGNDLGVAP